MKDVYDNTEDFNLEIVLQNDVGGGYEYDMLVVWKEKTTNKIYWATDSGCSCTWPFREFNSVEDLNPLPETLQDFKIEAKDHGIEIIHHVEEMLKDKK